MAKHVEATIVINGVPLTERQSTTVRCAIDSFATHIAKDGCGDDELGKGIAATYLEQCQGITMLLFATPAWAKHAKVGRVGEAKTGSLFSGLLGIGFAGASSVSAYMATGNPWIGISVICGVAAVVFSRPAN